MQLLLYFGYAVGGAVICWIGSGVLEDSSKQLAVYYHLPAIVQGAIITAVGSSFPELSSAVLAPLVHGSFDLGVGAIVGSALFNILVIPGVSGLVGGPMPFDRLFLFKEVQFYVTSIAVLLLTFLLAALYYPLPGPEYTGTITRPLALIPLGLYGLYLFLQVQAINDYEGTDAPSDLRPVQEWGKLLLSLGLILAGTEGLLIAAEGFGNWFGTPSFLWGLTVVAAGTSLPDMFVSVRAARDGRGVVSLANVLGSNVFDLLVAIPVGVLLAGASTINVSAAVPMMGILAVATLYLFVVLRLDQSLSVTEAGGLLVLYGAFLVLMTLETGGVIDLMT